MVWGLSADTSDEEFWEIQARNKRREEERAEQERWRVRTKEELRKEILEELKTK